MTSPYRTELDALRERKATLEAELAQLRSRASGLEALRAAEAKLASDLRAVESQLGAGARRTLPMLDDVRVASPCNADWNQMVGDDRVRFCGSCQKNVYNLSSMAREEAEALLAARMGGETCVRFYRRADGTMLTSDCPVGQKKKRRRLALVAVAGAGAMAAAAFAAFERTQCRPLQGAVAQMGDVAPPVMVQGEMATPPEPAIMGTVAPPPPAAPVKPAKAAKPARR